MPGSNQAASTRIFLVSAVIIVSQPPITPASAEGLLLIGDDQVFGVEHTLDAI